MEFEYFSLASVIKRDGPNCYICDRKTDRRTPKGDPLRPELEHVIPISRGGPHTPANLKCACRRCNGMKGYTRTPLEVQLLLLISGEMQLPW